VLWCCAVSTSSRRVHVQVLMCTSLVLTLRRS